MLKEFIIAASLSGFISLVVTIVVCLLQGLMVVACDGDEDDEDDEK